MERQEKGHFTDCEAKGNIYNPMYTNEPTVYNVVDDAIVEMGSVYKGEDSGSFHYENELRSVVGDRRWNRFGNGIETGSVIDLFLDKNNPFGLIRFVKHGQPWTSTQLLRRWALI
jgi:hypothetical protein